MTSYTKLAFRNQAYYVGHAENDASNVTSPFDAHLFDDTAQGLAQAEAMAKPDWQLCRLTLTVEALPHKMKAKQVNDAGGLNSPSELAAMLIKHGLSVMSVDKGTDKEEGSVAVTERVRVQFSLIDSQPMVVVENASDGSVFHHPACSDMSTLVNTIKLELDQNPDHLKQNEDGTFVFSWGGMGITYPLMNENSTESVTPAFYGFQIIDTGGGCTAWNRWFLYEGGRVMMMITDTGGCTHDVEDGDTVVIGVYNEIDEPSANNGSDTEADSCTWISWEQAPAERDGYPAPQNILAG